METHVSHGRTGGALSDGFDSWVSPEYPGKTIAPLEMKLLALSPLTGPFAVVPSFAITIFGPLIEPFRMG